MCGYSHGVVTCTPPTHFTGPLYGDRDICTRLRWRHLGRTAHCRVALRKEPPEVCECDYFRATCDVHVADARFVGCQIQHHHFPKPFRDIGDLHQLVDGLLTTPVLSAGTSLWRAVEQSQSTERRIQDVCPSLFGWELLEISISNLRKVPVAMDQHQA